MTDIEVGSRYVVGLDPTWDWGGDDSRTEVGRYAGKTVTVCEGHLSTNVLIEDGDGNQVYIDPRHLTPYVEAKGVWVAPVGTPFPATDYAQPLDLTAVLDWIRRLDGQASAFAAQRDAALAEVEQVRTKLQAAEEGWNESTEAWGKVQAVLPQDLTSRESSLVQDTLDHITALTQDADLLRQQNRSERQHVDWLTEKLNESEGQQRLMQATWSAVRDERDSLRKALDPHPDMLDQDIPDNTGTSDGGYPGELESITRGITDVYSVGRPMEVHRKAGRAALAVIVQARKDLGMEAEAAAADTTPDDEVSAVLEVVGGAVDVNADLIRDVINALDAHRARGAEGGAA